MYGIGWVRMVRHDILSSFSFSLNFYFMAKAKMVVFPAGNIEEHEVFLGHL